MSCLRSFSAGQTLDRTLGGLPTTRVPQCGFMDPCGCLRATCGGQRMRFRAVGHSPGGRLEVSSAEDAMLLWAVEPLEGCQCPLLNLETPFLHVPAGQEGEGGRWAGCCRALLGKWPGLLEKDRRGVPVSHDSSLPPTPRPPAHLPERPVSRGPQ